MTGGYQLQGPARICALSGRELRPGERIVSVLSEEEGKLIRRDYAPDVWQAPESGYIAYWSGRVPQDGKAKPIINDELLLDCFEHLATSNEAGAARFRYVVALLLMRRRRLKFEDTRKEDDREILILRDAKSGRLHEAADPKLTEAEMESVQDEVFRVLGWS